MIEAEFRPVTEEDLPKLLQLLKCDFPRGIHAYSFIDTLYKWRQKDVSLDIHFLAPGGNYRHGVFFYMTFKGETRERLTGSFYASTMEGHKKLVDALNQFEFDWARYIILFSCMQEHMWNCIQKVFVAKGCQLNVSNDNVYWMPWQEAKDIQVKIPDTMYIADLKPEHADTINSIWPHKFRGSSTVIEQIIKLNFGIGLFLRGSSELISWAVYWNYGGIGSVQTVEKYKRKGCASATVQAITRKMGSQGLDVHLNVVNGNSAGNLFFTKQGFRFAFISVWAFSPDYDE